MKQVLLTLLFWLFCQNIYAAIEPTPSNSTNPQVMVIADIHFNPFADCKNDSKCLLASKLNDEPVSEWSNLFAQSNHNTLPAPREETNYALWQSLLKQIQLQKPQQVFILGDFLAHRFHVLYVKYSHDKNPAHYQQFVIKTIQYITDSTQKNVSANTSIYPVIGNNDSFGGNGCAYPDYCIIANGPFYKELSVVLANLFRNDLNKQSFLASFPKAGYYDVVLPGTRDHIIVLNTVIFSHKAQGPNIDEEAKTELNWLHDKLQSIADANEKTWIIYHIPPGIDAYSTTKNFFSIVVPFWESNYSKIFSNLIHQYSSQITAVLSGHLHMDGFLVLGINSSKEAIIDTFVASISPIYGNNPSYKIYTYTPGEFKLHNFAAFYLDLKANQSEWKQEYDFKQAYQPKDGLSAGYAKVSANKMNPFSMNYMRFYAVDTQSQPITAGKWPYYWCATQNLEQKTYQACLKGNLG